MGTYTPPPPTTSAHTLTLLNTLIKDPFRVVKTCPVNPNPLFNRYHPSECLFSTSCDQGHDTSSSCSILSQPEPVEKKSVAIQTEVETWDTQIDFQLTTSSWSTEIAIADFEQQNKDFLIELNNFKVSFRSANG